MIKIPPHERIYDISISLRDVKNYGHVVLEIGISTGNLEEAVKEIEKLVKDFRTELKKYEEKK